MRLLSKNRKLILQQFDIDFLFLNGALLHNFDGKGLAGVLVHAESDEAEGSLSQRLTKDVAALNVFHLLELFIVINMQWLFARREAI